MKSWKKLRYSVSLLLILAMLGSVVPGAYASNSEISIVLSDTGITVDGLEASEDASAAVYLSHDIIYYEDRDTYDSGNPYGEGTSSERHSAEEAAAHTVVNITEPGTYCVTGKLSQGQIFVDLGKDAKTDPDSVVTLILDNTDITCTVAPAVFFYRVYECDEAWVAYDEGETEDYTASATQDTSKAGANVILADGSVNSITGSHVARIYKDNAEQKKLHKYDGAFYSRMSMNMNAQGAGTGVLNVVADYEGLDSELHLTVNGGKINIQSQNDGINTNEDHVSVTTINGGAVHIVAGLGSEGDGIDSNGYLVINGGVVIAIAKPQSDSGLDSDDGSYINGGYVVATGSTMDWAESDSEQVTMNLQFASSQSADEAIIVTDLEGKVIFAYDPDKDETTGSYNRGYQGAVISCPQFQVGETYYVYIGGDVQGAETDGLYDVSTVTGFTGAIRQQYTGTDVGMFGPGGMRPDGFGSGMGGERPDGFNPGMGGERPDGFNPGMGGERPDGQRPGMDGEPPELPDFDKGDGTPPDGFVPGGDGMNRPGGWNGEGTPDGPNNGQGGWDRFPGDGDTNGPASILFYMTDKVNAFSGVSDEVESTGTGFSDVSSDAWYYNAVQYVARSGMMSGVGDNQFSPGTSFSRAMLVQVLYNLEGRPAAKQCDFSDVADSAWYAGAVNWAAENGIVSGYNGRFDPEEPVTREQMSLVLYNYTRWKTGSADEQGDLSGFADGDEISDWALTGMKWAVGAGLFAGDNNGLLNPIGTATRAEAAQVLMNFGRK